MPPPPKRRRLGRVAESGESLGHTQTSQTKRPEGVEETPAESEDSSDDDTRHSSNTGESYRTLLQAFDRTSSKPTRKNGSPYEENSTNGAKKSQLLEQKFVHAFEKEDDRNASAPSETESRNVVVKSKVPEELGIDANSSHLIHDDEEDATDPFEVHFANPVSTWLNQKVKAINGKQWKTARIPAGPVAEFKITYPASEADVPAHLRHTTGSIEQLKLKKKLLEPSMRHLPTFDLLQASLATLIFNYHDLLFSARNPRNAQSLRSLATLHALNHIYKTRDKVIKNNNRLARDGDVDVELRDQGFTRPKVLILMETRQSCSKYVDTIVSLCAPEQQENKKRFQDAFVRSEDTFSDEKPEDFRELFEGNDDNEFRLGVKFTRKTMKYFSQFYNSDLILASPLGLRRAMKTDDRKKADYDFLSSIELIIVDQADAMLMQNWEHVEFIFEHLNLQPKESHGCDFSRVRRWYLDQQAKYLRQTIVFSAFLTPELNGLFSGNMMNVAGKVKTQQQHKGVMLEAGLPNRQTFSRVETKSPVSEPDDRFTYFTSTIIPMLKKLPAPAAGGLGVLIFIPSYLDFVRLRNFFSNSTDAQDLSVGSISEYTELSDMRRAQSHFLTGKHSVLLYSGRAHHFRRNIIRGVKKVVMYGLPDNPAFYTELVGGFLGATMDKGKVTLDEATVRVLFSKFDGLSLERIVGTERVGRMLSDTGGDTFDFR